MNKNRYRIIYNKARQMFMAVAENVKSQSKTSGQSHPSSGGTEQAQPFHQLWQVKCLVASMSLWMPLAPVYAQIQADPAANAANRPVIGVGKNTQGQDVAVINIQAPNSGGVSHNIYKQLDVLPEGAVLNNSRTGATSQIVGSVSANPFLAKGEARIILNEVSSNIASRFEGNLEVAGQRADVILANPAGINIKGGGFINANKAILTTGKPQLNADGSIKQFVVDQGKITVSGNTGSNLGLGGNNNSADYVDLYARAIELNAQLHANKDIQAITGANTISADLQDINTRTGTGTVPTLAIDVKNLGGMYANNIYLMGNEKGLGVNNAGTIRAINNLVITSAGKIEHTGTIESTSASQGLVNIQTTQSGTNGIINTSGLISSKGLLNIDSASDINLKANQIKIDVGTVSPLILNATGNLNITSGANIRNYGTDGADIYLDAKNITIGDNSIIGGNGSTSLNASENITAGNATELSARYQLNLVANKKIKTNGTHLTGYQQAINIQSTNQDVSQSGVDLTNGNISTKKLNIYSSGDNAIKDVGFSLENNLSRLGDINLYSGRNLLWNYATKATPQFTGKINIEADNTIQLDGALLSATQGLNLQAKGLTLNSALNSSKDLNITATQNDLSISKDLNAIADINVSALAGKLTSSSLKATSTQGKIAVMANKDLTLSGTATNQSVLTGAKGVAIGTVGDGNISLQNTVLSSSQDGIVITSNARNTLKDTTMTAKGNIELFAKDHLIVQNAKAKSDQHIALNSQQRIYLNSNPSADANDWKAQWVDTKAEFDAQGVLSLTASKSINVQDSKLKGGALLLESGGSLETNTAKNQNVVIQATGSNLLKNDQKLNTLNGDLSIQTENALTIDPKIHSLNAVGDISLTSKKGALTLLGYGGQAGNGSEKVLNLTTSGGGISLEGASIEVQGAQLNSQKDINLVATQGNVKVDGVKNNFYDYLSEENIKSLEIDNEEKVNLKNDLLNKLNADSDYRYLNESRYQVVPLSRLSGILGSLNEAKSRLEKKFNVSIIINDVWVSSRTKRIEINIYNDYDDKIDTIQKDLTFFKSNSNGYEHTESKLNSNNGNINITSAKGISITGTNIDSKNGTTNIEAQGVLDQLYTSTTTKGADNKPTQLGASIIIDGHTDFYDKGNENDASYSMRTLISPTIINGNKGVSIRATGTSANDNLVLQATGITSQNGDVRIEANKNILFDAAIEQSYDRSTTTEKKKSWGGLKKKYVTTVAENNAANAASVDISGKNIFIESKEKNASNNIDIYSGLLTADGGKISIKSGGNINLYTVEESSSSNVDITKKSSFAGIKYNKSNTNATRTQVTELPGKLKADYIGIKADNDVRLVGTEFEYLQGATIEAGRNLELLKASTTVTETLKKEKNSVVWQSMQDKGSITETAELPRFNGPTLPEFKAGGGLIVQVPISENDVNKKELKTAVLELANRPGNEYLKELVNRNDIDWQKVILTQKDWDYKSQGLTGAGAAIIVIIVTILTYGAGTAAASGAAAGGAAAGGGTTVGLGASMIGSAGVTTVGGVTTVTTVGTMANAAAASLLSQASVSLINNGGDISQTLKDLGSKDSIRNLAASIVTAGLMSQVSTALQLKPDSSLLSDRLINNFTSSVGSTLIQTAIKGGDLEDNLQAALLAGLAGSLQGELAQNIKGLEDVNYVLHKIAHAAVGCAAAAATKQSCEAGAIGAGVGEVIAQEMLDGRNPTFVSTEEKVKIEAYGKLIAGTISAYAGYDVNTAANSATIAMQNNAFKDKALLKIEETKKYLDESSRGLVDSLTNAYKKGDIKAAQNLKNQLDDAIGTWATSSSYEVLGVNPKAAVGALVYAVGELAIPTNVVEVIPVGKLTKAEKALGIVGSTASKTGKDVFDATFVRQIQSRTDVQQLKYAEAGTKGNWSKEINGKLDKNTAYLVSNGHTYVTDSAGRVKEVSGELQALKMDRNGYQQGCAGKCGVIGDEGGHLIAASLGGAGDRINIVPQSAVINRNDYRAMEKELSEAVSSGQKVSVKIEVRYPSGNGARPNNFKVYAQIGNVLKEFKFNQ